MSLYGRSGHIASKCFHRFDVHFAGVDPALPQAQPQANQAQYDDQEWYSQPDQQQFEEEYCSPSDNQNYNQNMHNQSASVNIPQSPKHQSSAQASSHYVLPQPQVNYASSHAHQTSHLANDAWLLDNGATNHVTAELENLTL